MAEIQRISLAYYVINRQHGSGNLAEVKSNRPTQK